MMRGVSLKIENLTKCKMEVDGEEGQRVRLHRGLCYWVSK